MPVPPERLEAAYQTALAALLRQRHPDGYWVGELSTSALSTATAVMALFLVQKHDPGQNHGALIRGGLDWLAHHQNDDGGWGDTTVSFSNISTTMLCRAAIVMAGVRGQGSGVGENSLDPRLQVILERAEHWLFSRYGATPAQLAEAVRNRYGKDRTFATPILTTCALAGLVSWEEVPPLPFELACLPQSWFRFVRLHVVSYALPALIAIGRCIFEHRKPLNPVTRLLRALSRQRSMRVLQKIQPSSGGFLEATPLTSFVTLSLAACGLATHPVTQLAVSFLVNSVRPDGSWPIDSNLSTWVTTLSINALAAVGELESLSRKEQVREWLLNQQHAEIHPYTRADPGGWAWTPLPGGVPDADDTPGTMIALRNLSEPEALATTSTATLACDSGSIWLLGLQNRDGGIPTFCKGWGHLPFDRSGADLTAHVLRAFAKLQTQLKQKMPHRMSKTGEQLQSQWHVDSAPVETYERMQQGTRAGLNYLARTQRPDGSWLPLWFGNQHAPDDENPTYGTARVLAAYRDLDMMSSEPAQKGIRWLLSVQNADGGWGGAANTPSSIEETALALEILVEIPGPDIEQAVNNGLDWLVDQVEQGRLAYPTPIGFYFAKLWYFEKLYPIIFTVAALGRARLKHKKTLPPEKR